MFLASLYNLYMLSVFIFNFIFSSMRKILFSLLLLLAIFPVYAQQDPNISNLGDLLIRFCNDPEVAKE